MGISVSMDNSKIMSVKIISVAKQLPKHTRSTADILPYLEVWLAGQEERFMRKVLKIFENAGVDRRYSIMEAEEVFLNTSFEEKNDIYIREVIKLAESALLKSLEKANQIMLNIHNKGKEVCGIYPLEIAETKMDTVHSLAKNQGFPLKSTLEKE